MPDKEYGGKPLELVARKGEHVHTLPEMPIAMNYLCKPYCKLRHRLKCCSIKIRRIVHQWCK